jgi:hypothetical protein
LKLTFVKLQLSACQALADNKLNPPYLRLYHLTLVRANPNGHANFQRGELSKLLSKGDNRYRNVESAIDQAVGYGLLAGSSELRCLVLPDEMVDPWNPDAAKAQCVTHAGNPAPSRTAACHPDRKHYAKDMCETCYRTARRKDAALAAK